MKLILSRSVLKMLARVQPKVAAAIRADLKRIAEDPFAHHPAAKPLVGRPDCFRYRHGGWRVLYRLDRPTDTMLAEDMDTRGDIY